MQIIIRFHYDLKEKHCNFSKNNERKSLFLMTGVSFIVFESLLHMYLVVEKDGTKMD